MGYPYQVSLAWNLAARLVGESRELHNLRLFVAGCLGLGAGPLMSSLATALANLVPCHLDGFEGMLAFVALLPWMQLSVLLRPLPSLEQLAACRAQGQASRAQAVVVCLCLAMLVLRNLSLASLEVGTAELFQKKYHFPPVAVGFFCALIVFTALPVQLFYERLQGQISLHSMLWASFAAGCFLMLESFSALFTASMLFFPMMALSSGIVMAHRRPQGVLVSRAREWGAKICGVCWASRMQEAACSTPLRAMWQPWVLLRTLNLERRLWFGWPGLLSCFGALHFSAVGPG